MSAVRTTLVALVAGLTLMALTVAVWPASEADKARDDGEQLGEAMTQVYEADSQSELDAALAEVNDAVRASGDHAGDAVTAQAERQADALDRAVDGYYGAVTTTDDWEQELYETQLDYAVTDLQYNADEFRGSSDDVVEAYWDGFDNGFDKE